MIASTSLRVTVQAPGSAPAWWLAQPDNTWVALAGGASYGSASWQRGSTVYDVRMQPEPTGNEGVTGVMNDWTSGCALQATGELILPCQGGHVGYNGNEIYALALREQTPTWRRIKDSSSNAQLVIMTADQFPLNGPYYHNLDDTPAAIHGWHHVHATENPQRIWLTLGANTTDGHWTSDVWSIARQGIANNAWMYHGRLFANRGTNFGSNWFYQSGPGAVDPLTNKLWKGSEGDNYGDWVRSIDPSAAVAAGFQGPTGPQVPGSTSLGQYHGRGLGDSWSAIPSVRKDGSPFPRRCWIVSDRANSEIGIVPLDDPSSVIWKSVGGSWPRDNGSGMSAHYHPASQAILVGGLWDGDSSNAEIWKLSVPNDLETGSFAWTTLSPAAGNTVVPATGTDQFRGAFGKFQLIHDLGDGRSALVVVANVFGPTYVYKLPAAGV